LILRQEEIVDRQTMIKRLGGCYLAVPTLFDDDLALNLDGMRRHVEFMLAGGLREGNAVLLVNGAAGEFPVLSLDERRQTAETVVRAASARIAVIVGAQATGTREACEIARHAQAIGAAALQVSAPYYYLLTDDDVYEHFAAVATAAPELGIVVYTTYWLTHQPSLRLLERLAEIPQVAAIKWGSPDIVEYQVALLRFAGRLGVIDNQLLPVFNQMMGGSGVNLHPALFWPEWGVKVWRLLETRAWDAAQAEINRLLLPYYELSGEIGTYTGGEGHIDKAGLELAGLPGGRNRPPTRPLPPIYKERLRQLCLEAGMPLGRV
jgi:dihydrodipicolinate synthase/N-acetylneuraminate lyase